MLNLFQKIFLTSLLLTAACLAASDDKTELSGTFRDKDYQIVIAKSLTSEEKKSVESAVKAVFDKATATYDSDNPNSEVSKLSKLPIDKKVTVSPLLGQLFAVSEKINFISGGLFDPTMGALGTLWTQNLEKGKLPSKEAVQKACSHTGWKNLKIQGNTFWKTAEVDEINFGAIFKGFTIDQIIEKLKGMGYTNFFIKWSETMRALGTGPKGSAWQVFVRESRLASATDDPKKTFKLKDQALASSSDLNQQKWTVDGKPYTSVINPKTCEPLPSLTFPQISALADSSAEAEGLASAGKFLTSLKEALSWEEKIKAKIPGASFWFMTEEGAKGLASAKK